MGDVGRWLVKTVGAGVVVVLLIMGVVVLVALVGE